LRRGDHSSKESYRLCKKDYETEEEAGAQQRAVEPVMNENEYVQGKPQLNYGERNLRICGSCDYVWIIKFLLLLLKYIKIVE
jgi:hypothetical protein